MKKIRSILMEDSFRLGGMIFLAISAAIFGIIACFIPNSDSTLTAFFICYFITAAFTFFVLLRAFADHGWRISKSKLDYTTLMLLFWLISAFAFNKQMTIFDNSTIWLCIYLSIAGITVLAAIFQKHFSVRGKYILSFFLGAALVLFTYYTFYLFPLYIFGALAAIFLGLSAHVFAPAFLCLIILTYSIRFHKINPSLKYAFVSGIILPVLIFCGFLFQWISIHGKVIEGQEQSSKGKSALPEWVEIAQRLPKSIISEKFLKAGLVYTTPSTSGNWFWGDFGRNDFDEARKHDPMVMTCAFLTGKAELANEDRIHILKSVFDSRHLAAERLWSGDDLTTTNVRTDVQIYPEYRLAYTEQIINIRNNTVRPWANPQEAIYTFQLPDAAVVSSLSLWIEGREEKARLTTKGKADSAYRKIVGVEARDPSVIHWQEGNQVTVRVFPCTSAEERKFKIGITSPLQLEKGRLIYQNSDFKGPNSKNAKAQIQVSFSSIPKLLSTDLTRTGNIYTGEGSYQDAWTLSMSPTALENRTFSFNDTSYQIKDAGMINTYFKPEFIYLDLNNTWTKAELQAIWPSIRHKTVYAFDGQLIQLNTKNLDQVFDQLGRLNFSMYPFYSISKPEQSLVITKTTGNTPNLSDLDESKFYAATKNFLAKATPVHVYNLGTELSPYLQTLKQFGILRYSSGPAEELNLQLQQNRFRELQELSDAVTIASSRLIIQKTKATGDQKAPDHLLRLFAYQDILKQIGPGYFQSDYINDKLLNTADQAFIVSPVSSLVVLETKKDYERFDIDESKNSLKNASLQSSGAAPEPHEWLLIILCISIMGYTFYQSDYFKSTVLKWR
jgi:XrtN system VIT domain protein